LSEIRILLVGLPPLVLDLVEPPLRAQHDFRIFGPCEEEAQLAVARETRPHVIIMAAPNARNADTHRFFDADPAVKVLCLETRSGRAFLYELLGDISSEELVEAIRRAACAPVPTQ